nr:MAG TPA: hypothetical protein [Bacteriophage sp.]
MCLFAVGCECTGTDIKFSFDSFAGIVNSKWNLIAGCITAVGGRHNVTILLIRFILACCGFCPEMNLNCFCLEVVVFVSVVYDLLQCCKQIRSSVCIKRISVRRNFIAIVFKCGFSKNVLRCFSVWIEFHIVLFQVLSKTLIFRCQSPAKGTCINIMSHILTVNLACNCHRNVLSAYNF